MGTYSIPYTVVSEGDIDKFYDSQGSYKCETDLRTGITTCTEYEEIYPTILSFFRTYGITWDTPSDSSTVKAKVLDEWKYSVKPTKIGTFITNYPFDRKLSETENYTPKEDWYLYFKVGGKEVKKKISEWLALSETEQRKFLGITEPKTPTGEGEKPPTGEGEGKGLAGMLSSLTNAPQWLWAILASALIVIVSVLLWLKKRAKKAKEKTEVVAMKYGKYSQDIVDLAA